MGVRAQQHPAPGASRYEARVVYDTIKNGLLTAAEYGNENVFQGGRSLRTAFNLSHTLIKRLQPVARLMT